MVEREPAHFHSTVRELNDAMRAQCHESGLGNIPTAGQVIVIYATDPPSIQDKDIGHRPVRSKRKRRN